MSERKELYNIKYDDRYTRDNGCLFIICECGESIYIEPNEEPTTCDECGKIYNAVTTVYVKEKE